MRKKKWKWSNIGLLAILDNGRVLHCLDILVSIRITKRVIDYSQLLLLKGVLIVVSKFFYSCYLICLLCYFFFCSNQTRHFKFIIQFRGKVELSVKEIKYPSLIHDFILRMNDYLVCDDNVCYVD